MTNENTVSQDPATSADEQEITEHQYRKLKRKLKEYMEVNRLANFYLRAQLLQVANAKLGLSSRIYKSSLFALFLPRSRCFITRITRSTSPFQTI